MKLVLYNNFSETNQLNKNISKIIELEGSLLDATSIINPVIKIFFNPEGMESYVVEDNQAYIVFNGMKITWDSFIYDYVLAANYAYIPEFNRYYFINDIISVRKNIWQLVMNVDVLMSYKDHILKLDAFVTRNEFNFNPLVKDDLVSYYYDKNVIEYIPEKGNKVNKTFDPAILGVLDYNITITCINEDIDINAAYAIPPDASLPSVVTTTTGDGASSSTYITRPTRINTLSKRLINDDTLASFILSIMIFPFTFEKKVTNDFYLKLGNTTLDDSGTSEEPHNDAVLVNELKKNISEYFIIADFTITADSYLDYEPYTQYEIYLPYMGWMSISADNILNNRIIVYYIVNYVTGSAQVNIYDITNKKLIYTGGCQLGVKVGITSTNQREVNDNRNSNIIGLGVGLLTSSVSLVAGAVTANPVAIAGGVISAGSNIAKFIQNNNTNYLKASGNVNSGQTGLYLPQDVRIRKTIMKPKNYNEDYAKLMGKPLNEYRKLNTLHGFTTVGNLHIENIASASRTEHDQIKTLLEEGIIL